MKDMIQLFGVVLFVGLFPASSVLSCHATMKATDRAAAAEAEVDRLRAVNAELERDAANRAWLLGVCRETTDAAIRGWERCVHR